MIVLISILFFLLNFISFYNVKADSSWNIQDIYNKSRVLTFDFTLDSRDYPHICYRTLVTNLSSGSSNNLMYTVWNGSSWITQTIDSSLDNSNYCSLDLDSRDIPHICYFDKTNGDLKYAYLNNTKWEIQVVESEGIVGYDCSIALDNFDNIHIAYYDRTKESVYNLKYAFKYKNAYSWTINTIDSNYGWDISFALNSENDPSLTIFDFYRNQSLTYIYWSEFGWIFKAIDLSLENYSGVSSSLCIDSNDKPHIAYLDLTNDNLKYAFIKEDWIIDQIDSDGFAGSFCSLDLDEYNNPHISYEFNDNNLINVKYAYWNKLIWDIDTIDLGRLPIIDLDNNIFPHVCYLDYSGFIKYSFPDIRISSPVKNEIFNKGVTYEIEFDTKLFNDSFNIDLYKNNSYIFTIVSNYIDNKLEWFIPNDFEVGIYDLKIISNSNYSKYANTSIIIKDKEISIIESLIMILIMILIIIIIFIIIFYKIKK
jgi:hypothetical protein